jgi:hypothetical protein
VCFDFLYKFCRKSVSFPEELMCVLIFSTNSVVNRFFLEELSEIMVKNVRRYWCEVTHVLVSQILTKLGFKKSTEVSNFIKIGPEGEELIRADEHNHANTRVSQFCERGDKRMPTDYKPRLYVPPRSPFGGATAEGVLVPSVPAGIFFCFTEMPRPAIQCVPAAVCWEMK